MSASVSLWRWRSRRSRTSQDGGTTNTNTPAGCDSRRIAAPCVSMSRMASCPAAKYASRTARAVPYRWPCTSAHSANSPPRRHGPERRLIHEVVVAAVHFVRPRRPGRVRDRVDEVGNGRRPPTRTATSFPPRTAPTPPRASAGRRPGRAVPVPGTGGRCVRGPHETSRTSWDPPSRCASVLDWTADRMTWPLSVTIRV